MSRTALAPRVKLQSADDGFGGGGFDEWGGDDWDFGDWDPTAGDLGTMPDPVTTIETGADTDFSIPDDFGNAGDFGSYLPDPPAEDVFGPGYSPDDGPLIVGGDGFELPSPTAGTPADVPGGTIGVGTVPNAGAVADSSIFDSILDNAGSILGGVVGVVNEVLKDGANGGIGGNGGTTGTQNGSPSSPGNAGSATAGKVGFIDVNASNSLGVLLLVGVVAMLLWRK